MSLTPWQFTSWPSASVKRWPASTWSDQSRFPYLTTRVKAAANEAMQPLSELLSADLIESATDYHIHCDAPGVQNLEMTVIDGCLCISADRQVFHEVNNDFVHSTERSAGKISKRIALPVNADVDHAQAEYKDGILHVSFPKKAGAGLKKITIN